MINARVVLADLAADTFLDLPLPAVLPAGSELTLRGGEDNSLAVRISSYCWDANLPDVVLVIVEFCKHEDFGDDNLTAIGFRQGDPWKAKYKTEKGKKRCGSAS